MRPFCELTSHSHAHEYPDGIAMPMMCQFGIKVTTILTVTLIAIDCMEGFDLDFMIGQLSTRGDLDMVWVGVGL